MLQQFFYILYIQTPQLYINKHASYRASNSAVNFGGHWSVITG